ncbi:MAG: type II toxin-antitoxin system VapC family toxin [Candidatus Sumerlaeota bacterium]|nr:type II toxin-antitoxin system VapC family toxin [Candidatus Sumerlaeota bacterium]
MAGTLVDSNVILDVLTADRAWGARSSAALEQAANEGPLYINPIIYAEVSIRFARIEEMEEALPPDSFARLPLPLEAAFLAGKAFLAYRKKGGARRSTLPDFFIGAHAAVAGLRLLTRDASRYRTYFPSVSIVAIGQP